VCRIDLSRIIGTPARGIGKVTFDKMYAGELASLPVATQTKVQGFLNILAGIKQAAETAPASEAVRFALESSGLLAMYRKDAEEGTEHEANVFELVNLASKHDDALPPEGIEHLLEEAALQSEQDELALKGESDEKERIALMTVHASKGLEFDAVFVTGL